ncbi:FecR family protein [Janthinobacterium fluminis]|uniref:FecR domain-containing protein n=1 Tax=Janthinobacterium fluminis TaxID=2987524 RepID=A0ABT5K3V1_9BURK|nr:FecR domain-containing protein [Janthinobacterium fluminis]MDC8759662.1 FecR domain-containing protein [Janthinobacterium fluminis]
MKRTRPADSSTTTPAALQAQARVWLRTLTSGDVKPWDAEAFRRWLATSAAHKEAFYAVRQRWEQLRPGVGELLRSNAQAARQRQRSLHAAPSGRRAFLGAAVGAAAVAGVAVLHPPAGLWPAPTEWGADFRTAVGEQSAVTLAGAVGVTLNTQTSVRRQDDGGIDLLAGEAAVDLPAAGRPFAVTAGAGRSVGLSGRFEVRRLTGAVCVTCVEGAVRVEHPAGVRALRARQQLVYDAAAVGGAADIEPLALSAWRKGELVFSNARLAEVLDEINRYRAGRVVLLNEAVRNSRVSGRFVIKALDSALSQLQHNFDLRARALPGGLLLLS